MNGEMIKRGLKTACNKAVKHSPLILSFAAGIGVVYTAVLAVKATPKALILIEEGKAAVGRPLTKRETVAITWKCYIPSAASALLTVGCIIAGHSIQARRNAQLLAAYGIGETARLIYSQHVRNQIGVVQEQAIRNQTTADIAYKKGMSEGKLILLDNTPIEDICPMDKILPCLDYISNRGFQASRNQIKQAVEDFNEKELKVWGRSSINVLYSYFHNQNLSEIPGFDMLGWNYEKSGEVEAIVTPHLDDKTGELYLIVDFAVPPTYDF